MKLIYVTGEQKESMSHDIDNRDVADERVQKLKSTDIVSRRKHCSELIV